ncbi:HAD-IIIA family hydrolase [Candidatus Falkowbacteria bacterium]|nr:HAD-IIIA family hydrolase [Candidatus Falkowbacteria bacterium]
MSVKQAVILAGGLGARLRPLTETIPKPMIPINGRPFLEYLIELLKKNGIEEVVILSGYLAEKITEYFGDGSKFGLLIKYSIGTVEDETGARIHNAADMLHDEFLVMYGDNYWPMNLPKMLNFYRSKNVLAMTTVYNNKDGAGEYGFENNIAVGADGRVIFYDQTRQDERLNGTEIGFFILNKKVLEMMPADNFSFQTVIFPKLIEQNQLIGYRTDHPYYPITNIEYLKRAESFLAHKKVIFLDRDGVINKKMPSHDYVKKWEEFEFLPSVIPALKLLKSNGYVFYIVTNQRGISRGLMTIEDLNDIHRRMNEELMKNNIEVNAIYYCPHSSDDDCECRKPKPGMFFQAAREHHLNLSEAIYIGDDETDRQAGEAAEVKTFLVSSDKDLWQIAVEIIK